MIKNSSKLLFLISCLSIELKAQIDKPDVQVTTSNESHAEVHISMNKVCPNNLFISCITSLGDEIENGNGTNIFIQQNSVGHYISSNSGSNWTQDDNTPNGSKTTGDPVSCFDALGNCYFTHLTNLTTTGLDGYTMIKSSDNGLTFGNDIIAFPNFKTDKQWIAADDIFSSPGANNYYATWLHKPAGGNSGIFFHSSTDQGQTFINQTLIESNGMGSCVATGPNGEVYLCWTQGIPGTSINFTKSLNFGASFSINSSVTNYLGIRLGPSAVPQVDTKFNSRIPDFPSMAVDKSCSRNRGRIYITYPSFTDNTKSKSVIMLTYSDNQGASWSTPITISKIDNRMSFLPTIAVDDITGMVNVAYYSFDNPASQFETNVYLAYSLDGVNWSNIKASDNSFQTHPIQSIFGSSSIAADKRGDYLGLVSYDGVSYIAWDDCKQVFFSKVEFPTYIKYISSISDLHLNSPMTISDNRNYTIQGNAYIADYSPVSFNDNSKIIMKSCQSISFLPGYFKTNYNNNGSYLGFITNNCGCVYPGITDHDINCSEKHYEPKVVSKIPDKIISNERRSFSIYPNPASTELNIKLNTSIQEKIKLKILNMLGQEFYNVNYNVLEGENHFVIPCQSLQNGNYFVLIENTDGVLKDKFLIQHY